VVEPTLLTDSHTRRARALPGIRRGCGEHDRSWPAIRAAHLEEKPAPGGLHETLVAVRLIARSGKWRRPWRWPICLSRPRGRRARIYEGLTEAPTEVVPMASASAVLSSISAKIRFLTLGRSSREGQDVGRRDLKMDGATRERCASSRWPPRLDDAFYDELKTQAILEQVELIDALDHAKR
jgi:hypothetical protein